VSRPANTRLVSRIVAIALTTGVLAGLLTACGYKGPLYLPVAAHNMPSGAHVSSYSMSMPVSLFS